MNPFINKVQIRSSKPALFHLLFGLFVLDGFKFPNIIRIADTEKGIITINVPKI
jgi:hypothetical protein